MAGYETRTVTAQVELRGDDAAPVIVGHAATFDDPYQVGFFTERIDPGAFKRTLAGNPDVRLLIDHEGQPLARTKSGTLVLSTDDVGLRIQAELDPANPKVAEVTSALQRGDLDQMSFGFRVPAGGDTWDHGHDPVLRTIREASLSGGDVSIVTYPANENTAVHLRAQDMQDAHYTLALAMLTEMREGRSIDEGKWQQVVAALRGVSVNLAGHPPGSYTTTTIAAMNGGYPLITNTTNGLTFLTDQRQAPVNTEPVPTGGMPVELARRLLEAAALRHRA